MEGEGCLNFSFFFISWTWIFLKNITAADQEQGNDDIFAGWAQQFLYYPSHGYKRYIFLAILTTLKTRLMLYGSIGASIEVWWAVTVARVVGCGSYKWHIFMWHIWNSCFSCALAQVSGEGFIPQKKKLTQPQKQESLQFMWVKNCNRNISNVQTHFFTTVCGVMISPVLPLPFWHLIIVPSTADK